MLRKAKWKIPGESLYEQYMETAWRQHKKWFSLYFKSTESIQEDASVKNYWNVLLTVLIESTGKS